MAYIQMYKQTDEHIDRLAYRQMYKQTDEHADKWTFIQMTNRLINKQTD